MATQNYRTNNKRTGKTNDGANTSSVEEVGADVNDEASSGEVVVLDIASDVVPEIATETTTATAPELDAVEPANAATDVTTEVQTKLVVDEPVAEQPAEVDQSDPAVSLDAPAEATPEAVVAVGETTSDPTTDGHIAETPQVVAEPVADPTVTAEVVAEPVESVSTETHEIKTVGEPVESVLPDTIVEIMDPVMEEVQYSHGVINACLEQFGIYSPALCALIVAPTA